jgi:hypothetical protein
VIEQRGCLWLNEKVVLRTCKDSWQRWSEAALPVARAAARGQYV